MVSQERYADLHDFAPVGYFTLDRMGLITKVNLTGAELPGVKRGRSKRKPFSLFATEPLRDTFHRHYRGHSENGHRRHACRADLWRSGIARRLEGRYNLFCQIITQHMH